MGRVCRADRLASRCSATSSSEPWVDQLRTQCTGHRALRRTHAHRAERPRRLQVHRRGADRRAGRRGRPRGVVSPCTSRTAIRRQTTSSSPRPPRATGGWCRSRGSIRTRSPLPEAERCLAAGAVGIKLHPRAEDFPLDTPELERRVRARRRARATGPGPRRPGHPGARPARGRDLRAPPQPAPDPGPLRDLRSVLALARGARPSEPVLRHRVVVARRPAHAVRARPAAGRSCCAATRPTARPLFRPTCTCATRSRSGSARISCGSRSADRRRASWPAGAARRRPGRRARAALARDPLLDRIHTFLVSSIGQSFNGVDPEESVQLAQLSCDVARGRPTGRRAHDGPEAARDEGGLGGCRAWRRGAPRASLPGCR